MVGDEPRFRIETMQLFEKDATQVRLVIPKALFEDAPNLREFEGWFNVYNIELVDPKFNEVRCMDWIQLNPEALSMQLLRLAYIAALSEEGPFGQVE